MLNLSTKFQGCTKCKKWKKWQLFHATDFQSLMYPCFTFCNILGIFPYKINGSTFETSKQCYVLPTVVLCILCIYELEVLYEIDIARTIQFKGVPKTLERNCFYILGNFIAVVTYILSGRRMHLLQTIMNISSKLPANSYQKLSRLIHAKDIFGFIYLIGQTMFYCYSLDFDNWHRAFAPYLNLIVFQMDMLYINCVCVLKACFERIDDNLLNLQNHVTNNEPYILKQIYHERRNPFLLMELNVLKKQHLMISDAVQMLNLIFSLQLLASTIITFVEITFYLYFYIVHWRSGTLMNHLNKGIYDIYLLVIMIYYSVKIGLIIWACQTGKNQAEKIATTVHDVINNISDAQIKNELQLFSLQIMHRQNAFSAKGFIMDATLLTAVSKRYIICFLINSIQTLFTFIILILDSR
ncbi:Putative gustatory receptor 28b [Cyphomyrmex costatus]|uniref:Gustatory receptor n=1 Tax=Cyphomyrmex costatus TaxID=456900 RepID=A0A195CTB5_9HYME|nr:Putative gustatory receptor 28b [Cyphomyrmex costatus]